MVFRQVFVIKKASGVCIVCFCIDFEIYNWLLFLWVNKQQELEVLKKILILIVVVGWIVGFDDVFVVLIYFDDVILELDYMVVVFSNIGFVGDQDYGVVYFVDVFEDVYDFNGGFCIEVVGRFICQDDGRLVY